MAFSRVWCKTEGLEGQEEGQAQDQEKEGFSAEDKEEGSRNSWEDNSEEEEGDLTEGTSEEESDIQVTQDDIVWVKYTVIILSEFWGILTS